MKYIIVDIETDGPSPWNGSMLALGACTLDGKETFYTELKPREEMYANYIPRTVEWLKEQGLDRQQIIKDAPSPTIAILNFDQWLEMVAEGEKLRFVADNAGFDWMFVAYYLDRYVGSNLFGFSPLSLTSLNIGLEKNVKKAGSYKKLRTVKHTHNALDDALGNAGAMRALIQQGLVI